MALSSTFCRGTWVQGFSLARLHGAPQIVCTHMRKPTACGLWGGWGWLCAQERLCASLCLWGAAHWRWSAHTSRSICMAVGNRQHARTRCVNVCVRACLRRRVCVHQPTCCHRHRVGRAQGRCRWGRRQQQQRGHQRRAVHCDARAHGGGGAQAVCCASRCVCGGGWRAGRAG